MKWLIALMALALAAWFHRRDEVKELERAEKDKLTPP